MAALSAGLLAVSCSRGDATSAAGAPAAAAPPEAARERAPKQPAPAAPPASASSKQPAVAAAEGGGPAARKETESEAYRHPLPGRLIAIGDLHGDLAAARAALELGGAIDASGRWIGGNLTVVQTGDQLDRGDDEREIVDLFVQLAAAAESDGGQVIALNGNHELMNVQGDFRYVTPGAIGDFAGVRPRSALAQAALPPFEERAAAFLPGGAYALELARRDVIAVVGDSVFVHGGVLPAHIRYGIDRINRETRDWMRGAEPTLPGVVASDSGPLWARDYSLDPVAASACEALGEVLAALKVRRMVVGHTVQKGGISSACDDRVYRIDVGLSRYYGGRPIQVLELRQGTPRVLSAPRRGAGEGR